MLVAESQFGLAKMVIHKQTYSAYGIIAEWRGRTPSNCVIGREESLVLTLIMIAKIAAIELNIEAY